MENSGLGEPPGNTRPILSSITETRRESGSLHRVEPVALAINGRQHQAAFAGQAELLAQAAGMGIGAYAYPPAIARPDAGQQSSRDSTRPMFLSRIDGASSNSRWVRSTSTPARRMRAPVEIDLDAAEIQRADRGPRRRNWRGCAP